jgi:hypothetical protein
MNLLNRPQQNPAHREKVREVKRWVEELLSLSAEATVMVTELACSEPDCPPAETVVALLQENQVPLQEKTHSAVLDLKRAEVEQLCERLGKKLAASTGQPDRTGRR